MVLNDESTLFLPQRDQWPNHSIDNLVDILLASMSINGSLDSLCSLEYLTSLTIDVEIGEAEVPPCILKPTLKVETVESFFYTLF